MGYCMGEKWVKNATTGPLYLINLPTTHTFPTSSQYSQGMFLYLSLLSHPHTASVGSARAREREVNTSLVPPLSPYLPPLLLSNVFFYL